MDKMKHLEFIQNIITRHNSNTFMLKGWAITICSALFALSGSTGNNIIAFGAVVPTVMFWYLNAVFLANERCFRDLYKCVVDSGAVLPKETMTKEYYKTNLKITLEKAIELSADGTLPESVQITKTSDYQMNFEPFRIWKENNWNSVLCGKTVFPFYLMLFLFSIILGCVIQKKETENSVEVKFKSELSTDTLNINLIHDSTLCTPIYIHDTFNITKTIFVEKEIKRDSTINE